MTEELPLIPRRILFGNPLRTSPQISPDGKHLTFIAPVDNVLNVWIGELGASLESFKPITLDTARGIRIYFWGQSSDRILYLQDTGGDENWRLHSVDTTTGKVSDLTPFEDVQVRIVDVNKKFPTEILVAMNKDNPKAHDVYRLDIATGELTKIVENPGNQVGWGVDPMQKVRTATVSLPDGGMQLLIRDPDLAEPEWNELITWSEEDAMNSHLAGFNADSTSLYLIDSTGANAGRLIERDLKTGKSKLLLEDPLYDVSSIIQHPDTYALQAASVVRDKSEWSFFDPEYAADFEVIADWISGELMPAGRDDKDRLWLVVAVSDQKSPSYYLYDRTDKSVRYLFSSRPEIDSYSLAPMEPISFQSRDGLTIHGYLSLPVGKGPNNLPLVLNVHGGPWFRDSWGPHPEAQWLANRGYACLQVNFRGSTGYGKAFLNAGNKEWGGKMHDDLLDAVDWAVERGIATRDKVAIYGGSYGGYAALVGATFTPDVFCCAVDIVGPSSLITLIESIPAYWSTMLSFFKRRVGDPETEAEFLKSRSPLFKVDRIKIPMLISQGANDPRVKQAEAEQIVAAMKEKKIDYEYLLFPDEGHGFARPENRLKFYAAAEAFLSKHLGGRFEEQ